MGDTTINNVEADKNPKPKGKLKTFLSKLVIFKLLRSMDKKFVKPFLTNSRPTLIENLPRKFLPIAKLLTSKEQLEVLELFFKKDNLSFVVF